MRTIAALIFGTLLLPLAASSAKNSARIGTDNLPRKGGTSQFQAEEVVVKIGKRKVDPGESLTRSGLAVVSNHGTGYCLGPGACDFIVTNYHVSERLGTPLQVNGVKVLQTYEATGPQDKGAVWSKSPLGFSTKLVPVHDVAILRLKQPILGMHGIPFSTRELRDEEPVRIYGHPGGGRLASADATFYREDANGLLFFKVKEGQENILVPGISGSLVVNEKNEAVGLLQGVFNGNLAAVVPVWSLADFLKKVQANRCAELFPASRGGDIYRPNSSDRAPTDYVAESAALAGEVPATVGVSPPPALPDEYLWYKLDKPIPPLAAGILSNRRAHVRTAEPPEIEGLRANADRMAEGVNDLIAVGTQHSMGGKTAEVTARYQLRMVAGSQTFTMNGNEIHQLPCPKGTGAGLGSEWADFPSMVGNNLKLSVQQVDDLSLEGFGNVKVFRYEGTAEDNVAKINYCDNYGLGIHTEKIVSVPVRGEVWTDDALNILRITQEREAPPSMGWLNFRSSVLYGWLESPGGERRLVPTTIISRAELSKDHQVYSTLCRITDYHQFSVNVVVGGRAVNPIM